MPRAGVQRRVGQPAQRRGQRSVARRRWPHGAVSHLRERSARVSAGAAAREAHRCAPDAATRTVSALCVHCTTPAPLWLVP